MSEDKIDNAGEKDIFKDHVAKHEKHGEHLETLEFKKPGSSNYAIWFVRHYGNLMVWGDCYEATYQWSYDDEICLEWMAKLNPDYFIGKCRASPHGRKPYYWDNQTAKKELHKYFDEYKDTEEYDPEEHEDDIKNRAEEERKFKETGGWEYLDEGKEGYTRWAYDHAYEIFGSDWYEHVSGDPGKMLDHCIKLHLPALKAAVKQLKVNQVKTQEKT